MEIIEAQFFIINNIIVLLVNVFFNILIRFELQLQLFFIYQVLVGFLDFGGKSSERKIYFFNFGMFKMFEQET